MEQTETEIVSTFGNTQVRITRDAITLSVKKPGQEISDAAPPVNPSEERLEQWLDSAGDFRWRIGNAVDMNRLLCKISLSLIALNTVLLLCLIIRARF